MIYSYANPSIAKAINEAHEMRAAALRGSLAAFGRKLVASMHQISQVFGRSHPA